MFVALTEMGEVFPSGQFLHWFFARTRMSNSWVSLVFGFSLIIIWQGVWEKDGQSASSDARVGLSTHTVDVTQHNLRIAPSGKWQCKIPTRKRFLGTRGHSLISLPGLTNQAWVWIVWYLVGTDVMWWYCYYFYTLTLFPFISFHVSLMGWSPVRYVWHIIDLLDGFILLDYKLICFASILFWICFAFRW